MTTKVKSLKEAISIVEDHATIGVGGSLYGRCPAAAIYEIIRQRKQDLSIYCWSYSNLLDLIVAGKCVREIQSSDVGHTNFFRSQVDKGKVSFIKHSPKAAVERFRAGAEGLEFSVLKASQLEEETFNEFISTISSPFANENHLVMKAFTPDVAIVHAHKADMNGNVQFDRNRDVENDTDLLIAKSAKYTIVTVEQIVSENSIGTSPIETVLSGEYVDAVVEAPFGAYPSSCDGHYGEDFAHQSYLNERSQSESGLASYLEEYVYGTENWQDLLNKVGVRTLLSLKGQGGSFIPENKPKTTPTSSKSNPPVPDFSTT
ncbi:CoA transferase subunit A [Bacillus litorisediminis]|uniref:CoA transferase subunit A n=1 Tax=Bacillus litorisediminis TaxID=2922713 RepID=UPI001FABF884|nr:CoA-transferase [Bacillus litorisediminis]